MAELKVTSQMFKYSNRHDRQQVMNEIIEKYNMSNADRDWLLVYDFIFNELWEKNERIKKAAKAAVKSIHNTFETH